MSNLCRSALMMFLQVTLGLLTAGGKCAEPKSGFLESVLYSVDANGKPYGQKRVTRIWFDEQNTRVEEQIGNDITSVRVKGKHSWTTYPAAQRYLSPSFFPTKTEQCSTPFLSYPATIRNSYARSEAKQPFVAKGVTHGMQAWKYTWHQPASWAGDVGSGAMDGIIWRLADADFPIVLQNATIAGERVTSRAELLQLRRNIPIPPALFELPRNYKPILLTTLTSGEFRLEVKTTRNSRALGWQTQENDVFTGHAQQVIHHHSGLSRDSKGTITPFNPPDETLSWENGKFELLRALQIPYWPVMKKVGKERILNMEADILETVAEGLSEKFRIVNHPLFGTINLRRESPLADDHTIIQILTLEASQTLKR